MPIIRVALVASVLLASPAFAAFTLTANGSTNVPCRGGSNGTASIVIGGTPVAPYSITWAGAAGANGQTTASGLTANTYTATVTDAVAESHSVTFTITEPAAAVSGTTVVTNVCASGSNGSINLTPSGGTPGYTYSWVGGITTEDRTNLGAGTYSVIITDANGCTGSVSATVTQATPVSASSVVTNVACNAGSNGAINITPSGGYGAPYTFLWNSGATTEDRTGLAASAYSVTITDAAGCVGVVNSTVTQPSAINASPVITNVACFGGSTGAISLTPSGGTPGYTYNWGSGITSKDRTGLTAGAYSVTLTDANSCTRTVALTVGQPAAALTGSSVVTNVTCNGGMNASINLTPSGGTPGYTFNWGGGITTEDRTGLAAGSYSVTITDANLCTAVVPVTATQPAAVSGTTMVTNVACFGGSNASINLTPNGGTPGYTFNWGSGITTEDRTGLVAGTYSVTITDSKGCTGTVSSSSTQPSSALTLSTAVTNVACNGSSTGAINLTAAGGTPGYSYDWGSGITTEDRVALSAGAYSVTATDLNGCTASTSASVTQPLALVTSQASITPAACNGGSTGSATVGVTGGVSPYSYRWSSSASTTATASGLSAGTTVATVTDANSCSATQTFLISQPPGLSALTTRLTNLLCNGVATGAIAIAVDGGVGPFAYDWPGTPVGDGTNAVSSLPAGTQTLTIVDANSCRLDYSVTLTQPPAIISSLTSTTAAVCHGERNGSAAITASGGTGALRYDWAGTPVGDMTPAASGLAAGTTSVTVTDANACTHVQSATITEPEQLVVTVTPSAATCRGGTNGSASAAVRGGVGPYAYDWSPNMPAGEGTANVTGLSAGSITANVSDSLGCRAAGSATVTQPATGGAPVATAQSLAVNEETPLPVTLAASTPDCDTLSFNVVSASAHGTLTGAAPNLIYTPALNYFGADAFTFTAANGSGTSAPAAVSITVINVNDAPTANAQSVTVDEDTPALIALTGLDADNDPLTAMVVTQPMHGTLSGTPPMLTYTPAMNFNGTDSFTFTVSDGQATSAAATITLNVNAINDVPVAVMQSLTANEDTALTITLAGSDVEMSALTFKVTMPPAHGTLTGTAPNITYTPDSHFAGSDTFAFTVSDGVAVSAPVTVNITVVASGTMADGGALDAGAAKADAGTIAGNVSGSACGCSMNGGPLGAMVLLALAFVSRRRRV